MNESMLICSGCGKQKKEKNLKIYAVRNDKYFCNQLCLDKYREMVDGN